MPAERIGILSSPRVIRFNTLLLRLIQMIVPILDSSAWREFRGVPSSSGINETTHLAKIADTNGNLRDCFVKLLPLNYPALLGETIGWLLANASGVACSDFGAIVFVPLNELRNSIKLPVEFDHLSECPAWCCELVSGKSVRQIHKWLFWLARKNCLNSKHAREIAAFDCWTDLRDRNYGNVIRSSGGGYVSIDHETILHNILWEPLGRSYKSWSLLAEAKTHLSSSDFHHFQLDMANAAKKHFNGFSAVKNDIAYAVNAFYPTPSATLTLTILNQLEEQAKAGWLADELGVIA